MEARNELRRFMIKDEANKYFPDLEFKKPKLQHDYDALKDVGRILMSCKGAESEAERLKLTDKALELVTKRAAMCLTADTEGWEIAQLIRPETENFIETAKPWIKEARQRCKKGEKVYKRRYNNAENKFFRGGYGRKNRYNTRQKFGESTNIQASKNQTIKCYSCGGPHRQKDCPGQK